MKVGSLFSGIGGLDLGLERSGMKIVWQVEKDSYCQKVLKKHWPEVPCYGDIKEIDFSTLPPVDLICGGFPCQPVSCAGKRQGDKDERWLWPEFYRAICETRPRWVLVENVPGLLSASDGRLFGGILGDLARSGYDAEWDLLPAAAFGAPHLRFRVFLVAHAQSCRGQGREIYPGNQFKTLPRGSAGTSISGGERLPDVAHPQERQDLIREPGSLGEAAGRREGEYPALGDGGEDVAHSRRTSRSSRWPIVYGCCSENGKRQTIRIEGQGVDRARAWWATEPDVGRVASRVPSRVDRLKCLGNAVVPQVVEWIGRRIMEVEDLAREGT